MRLIADNIIFNLQKYGGISVVWNELLSRARTDRDIELTELSYGSSQAPRWMERYRIPAFQAPTPAIFHSSYFRILPQENVHNVTTVHDLTYHFYRRGLAKAVHLWEEERALRHSEAIICVSEHTRQDLLRCYPWIKETQTRVIYNGAGEEFFPMKTMFFLIFHYRQRA